MQKLAIIYGTRPEYLKLIILIKKLRQYIKVIRIGQHETLFEGEDYDVFIPITAASQSTLPRLHIIACEIFQKLSPALIDCDRILVQGDTATVVYAALAAFTERKQVIHLEAGLRTYNLENPYPEEGFRQIVSRITDIHLCPHNDNAVILQEEKVSGKIYVVGNTILDLVKSYGFPITNEPHIIITLHRRENWDEFTNWLKALFKLANENPSYTFTFITHMNPLLKDICAQNTPPSNFKFIAPLSHKDCIKELSRCSAVITDSGGIQEEANFLGKPIVVLRKITERNSIPADRIHLCMSPNELQLPVLTNSLSQSYVYGDGTSVDKICDILYPTIINN